MAGAPVGLAQVDLKRHPFGRLSVIDNLLMFEALHISDREYVLQAGRIVLEGPGKEL